MEEAAHGSDHTQWVAKPGQYLKAHACPHHTGCLWLFSRNLSPSLIPFMTSSPPPCLSHSFIIYDRQWSSLTVECVCVLAPRVAWELIQGVTIFLGLTAPVPGSHGPLAAVPC